MDSKFNKIALVSNFYNCKRQMISILSYNDDMLIEILLWLPAKSLIKFKSVCKYWLLLISSDQFCHLHTLRHPKPLSSLILYADKTSNFFYFDPILNPHKLIPYTFTIPNPIILSSCNGLFLLQSDQPNTSCYVYNPTTRLSRKISLTNSDKYTEVLGLYLAFDPSISSHYKIVCIRAATKLCCQIEVFESESSIWKLCVDPLATTINATYFSRGIYWKNAIHFFKFPLDIYFDTDKYVIVNMPPQPITHGSCNFIPFMESNGRLYHIRHIYSDHDCDTDHGDDTIAVYEMQDDYSQWLMKFRDGHFPRHLFKILRFIRGDDGEICTLVTHVPGKIMAYRFLDRSVEKLVDLTDEPFYQKDSMQFYRRALQFGESMTPV